MSSPCVTRKNSRVNCARALALLLSWLLFAAALPTGSLSKTSQPASRRAIEANASQATKPDEATRARISEAYGKLSLRFEANQGQADEQVRFLARGAGYSLFLTSTEAVMVLSKPAAKQDEDRNAKSTAALQTKMRGAERREAAVSEAKDSRVAETKSAVLRMKLDGANPASQAVGVDELPGKTNYFVGNEQQKWRTGVPSYAKVMCREVYPGVDMVYYGKQQQLEYDFVVAPGVDHRIIKLAFEGAQRIDVDAQGDLVLHTEGGEVRLRKPVVYQEMDGARMEIPSRYVVEDEQRVGFEVDAYDSSQPRAALTRSNRRTGFTFSPPSRTFNDLFVSPAQANTVFNATQ